MAVVPFIKLPSRFESKICPLSDPFCGTRLHLNVKAARCIDLQRVEAHYTSSRGSWQPSKSVVTSAVSPRAPSWVKEALCLEQTTHFHCRKSAAGRLGQRVFSSSSHEAPSDGPNWDPELEQPALIVDRVDEPIKLPEERMPGHVTCNGFLVDCYEGLEAGRTEAHFAATYEELLSKDAERGHARSENRPTVLASFYKDQLTQLAEVETLTLLAKYVPGFPAPLCYGEAQNERLPYFVIKRALKRTVGSFRLLSDADSVLWGARLEARERGIEDFDERFHTMRGLALSYISLACRI